MHKSSKPQRITRLTRLIERFALCLPTSFELRRVINAVGMTISILVLSVVKAAGSADLAPRDLQIRSVIRDVPNPSITYNFRAANQGESDADGPWWDRLYLSRQPERDGSEVLVGNRFFSGLLRTSEEYTQTNTVKMPLTESGRYYLILSLNDSAELEEIDSYNNVIAASFEFIATPADLKPLFFQTPSVVTGQPFPEITVVWGITNQGLGTAFGPWADGVAISTNQIDWDTNVFALTETDPVLVGEIYWRTNTFRVPVVQSGTYYLRLVSNIENTVFESEFDNNTKEAVIDFTVLPPDLVAVSLEAPQEIVTPPHPWIQVVWEVTNLGPGPDTSPGGWLTMFFSSTDDILDDGDYPAGAFQHTDLLEKGGVYRMTNLVRLSATQSGVYYLFVQVVSSLDSDTDNNIIVVPITVTVIPPDLTPIAISLPTSVEGPPNPVVTIAWGIENVGPGATVGGWGVEIYVSPTSTLNLAAAKAVFSSPGPVAPFQSGERYWATNTARIPVFESGTYYVFLVIENDEAGDENTSNDSISIAVDFDIAAPELSVLSLQAPDVVSAATFAVTWEVGNSGPGAIPSETTWTDRLYLSVDEILDPGDVEIAEYLERGPLSFDGGYRRTKNVSLPGGFDGSFHLIYVANDGYKMYEANTNNNHAIAPITYLAVQPDLAPFSVAVPTEITGPPRPWVTLVWGVTNQSANPAISSKPWSDNVYFSKRPIFDANAVWIGESKENTRLDGTSVVWHTNRARLPNVESGIYYFLFRSDAFEAFNESNEENNLIAVQITLDVRPSDLSPIQIQAPKLVSAAPNPVVELSWGVTNKGIGPAIEWSDGIYLSTNATLGPEDMPITTTTEPGPALPGDTYWRTNSLRVPVTSSGTYYLILKADPSDFLIEADESNNTIAIAVTFDVKAPDLKTLSIEASATITGPPNASTALSWSVANYGIGPALDWQDRLYFSHDAIWDTSDLEVARLIETGPLEPAQTYWRTNTVRVPAMQSGTYYWIVKADAGASVHEIDEGNNTSVTSFTFEVVRADLVPVIVSTPQRVVADFYQPLTPVTLVWGVTNQGGGAAIAQRLFLNRVYFSDETELDEDDDDIVDSSTLAFVQAGSVAFRTNTVFIDGHRSGTYYLYFKADADNSVPEANETNNIIGVPIAVQTIFPAVFTYNSVEFLPNGHLRFSFFGEIGAIYALESSTDLITWSKHFEFTCTSSPMQIVDTEAHLFDRRFYRMEARVQP